MAQSIEEQLAIIKAYAEGKPVYRRSNYRNIGEQVEEKWHQFNFESSVYSLTPLDWCTGKDAIEAYISFMKHGSESDQPPSTYHVTSSREDPMTKKQLKYSQTAMDLVDAYPIFIAGAEWVLRNKDMGIDYTKSLQELREKSIEKQREQEYERDRALGWR